MSAMLPTTAEDVENKRQQLLAALAALPTVGIGVDKPLLRKVQEDESSSWDDETWDFANARLLLSPQQQQEYAIRLLERQQAAEREAAMLAYGGGNIPGLGVATRGSVSTADLLAGTVPVREGDQGEPPSTTEEDEPYENWKVAELREEIRLRNEQRGADSQVTPASDRKEDLVSALEQDDQQQS